jgi:hypothetical protein
LRVVCLEGKTARRYLSLRREFEPTTITLVIVAESPPASGKYFYDPDGEVSEPLFNALSEAARHPAKHQV